MTTENYAISIKQPWAWVIAENIKNIENRSWKCPFKYLGKRIYIHASKGIDYKGFSFIRDFGVTVPPVCELTTGAIIGSFRIIRNVWSSPTNYWKEDDCWGWVLDDIKKFKEPIPCKGSLGFWKVPHSLVLPA